MSGITLERLLFNPSDLAAGPVVGSYLLAADGTVFTATDVGGKKSLDVNVANAISVSIDKDNDSIVAWQGGTWVVAATQSGSWAVEDNTTPNIVPLSQPITVTDTAVAMPPVSALSGRKRLWIQNLGADPIYIGKVGVLATTGIKVDKGATFQTEAGPLAIYYAVAATGKSVVCRVLES